MQEPEESTAEAEAERGRGLHLVGEARVVEAEPAHRGAQGLEVGRVGREEAAEHDRLGRLEARQRFGRRAAVVGDRVADSRVGHLLDLGCDIADFAGPERIGLRHLGPEHPDPVDLIGRARPHHSNPHALPDEAVDDAHQHDHAEIGVVPGIDEQRLQGRHLVALRRRQAGDDRLEHEVDVQARLGRDRHRLRRVEADDVLDLLLDPVRFGRRQVDLVQDRHDLMARVERVIDVGERLRLDPLARVDHQKRPLAGGERARHLVGEVDVAGRVHEVEDVGFAVPGAVFEPDGVGLDGDAAFALDVHRIEHLLDHIALRHRPRQLDEPVGERRLSMVDMRDDREVADVFDRVGGHGRGLAGSGGEGNRREPSRDAHRCPPRETAEATHFASVDRRRTRYPARSLACVRTASLLPSTGWSSTRASLKRLFAFGRGPRIRAVSRVAPRKVLC